MMHQDKIPTSTLLDPLITIARAAHIYWMAQCVVSFYYLGISRAVPFYLAILMWK